MGARLTVGVLEAGVGVLRAVVVLVTVVVLLLMGLLVALDVQIRTSRVRGGNIMGAIKFSGQGQRQRQDQT